MDSFLQSKEWMDFQKSLQRKIWEVDGINIIKYNLPFGKSYFYSPRCGEGFLSKDFLKKVREIAKKENAIFFKVEPSYVPAELRKGKPINKKFGLRKSQDIQPRKTLILDITKSEQELLDQMHHKTRYNIRLAEKKNIIIKKDKNRFEDFWRLIQKTTKRDGFRSHSKEYYKKIVEISGVELFSALNPAERGRAMTRVIAANIVVFYKKTAIYLHGSSDYKYRNLMAPYLLQWQQILTAKKRGCTEYDFWGIDEKKWPGVTRFKKGFCPKACKASSGPSLKGCRGKEVEYSGAYDLVFKPVWYRIYKIAKKFL